MQEQLRKEKEVRTAHTTPKQRCFDKQRLSALAMPRKSVKPSKTRKTRRRFNCSVDINQRFPEINGTRSKVGLKDTLVNVQKANIFG